MAQLQAVFKWMFVLSVVWLGESKYPVFKSDTKKLTALGVTNRSVFVGGESYIIKLDSVFLNSTTLSKEMISVGNTSWLLKVLESGKLLSCFYVHSTSKTNCELCDIRMVNHCNKTLSNVLGNPQFASSVFFNDVIVIGSKSCQGDVSGKNCYAIRSYMGDKMDIKSAVKSVKYEHQEKNHVQFHTAINLGDFVYFLYTAGNVSKLGKLGLCEEPDKIFNLYRNSFEDTPIQCDQGNDRFRIATDAVFWNRTLFVSFTNGKDNTVCRYDLKEVQEGFQKSRKKRLKCHNETKKNKFFEKDYSPTAACYDENVDLCFNEDKNFTCADEINGDFCDTAYFGSVEGEIPISSGGVVYSDNSSGFGSIVKLGIQDLTAYAVIYIGTSQGAVRKIMVTDSTEKLLGNFLLIQPTFPVLDIQVFQEDIFVLTENRVVNIAEKDSCPSTYSCTRCMELKNPKCGWDIAEQTCMQRSDINTDFLPSIFGECLVIKADEHHLEKNGDNKLEIKFSFYPKVINLVDELRCSIKNNFIDSEGNVTKIGSSFACNITNVSYSETIKVNVFHNETRKVIASGNVSLYSCNNINSCSECVKGMRVCFWCVDTFQCDESDDGCDSKIVNNTGVCPRITSEEALIPRGKTRNLELSVNNISIIDIIATVNLQCRVGSSYYSVSQKDGKVVCDNVTAPQITTNLNILRKGGNKTLDGSVTLKVYDCSRFNTCGECNYKARKGYDCLWNGKNYCEDSDKKGNSGNGPEEKGSNNQNSNRKRNKCNDAVDVKKITPDSGPVLGGTKITIEGTNLGYEAEDVSITIGDVPCLSISVIEKSKKLTCITGESSHGNQGTVVNVTVGEKSNTKESFSYKKGHSLTGFKPDNTIKAGGRKIRIEGVNITFPKSEYDIRFCNGHVTDSCLHCVYIKPSGKGKGNHVRCEVGNTDQTINILTHIHVTIDNNTVLNLTKTFFIKDNPTITNPNEKIKIFESGGSKFNISGTGFEYVDVIRVDGVDGNCIVSKDNTSATCEAPPKIESDIGRRRKRSTGQNLGLHFDNFNSQLTVQYTKDPHISSFGAVEYQADSPLVIEGSRLRAGAKQEDYDIKIGLDGRCNIEQLTDSNITCLPPKNVPRTNHSNENTVYVIVKVGRIERHVGYLVYEQEIEILAITVGSLAGAFLLAVGFGALLVFRFKKKKDLAEKEFEMKLSTMEQRIRETSREEFADAQMTIKDIKSDLVTSKVPYHDYQTFVFNHLFPNQDIATHPLLHQPMVTDDNRKNVEQAMDMFGKLLTNKMFLRVLVWTLDSNVNTLTMKDKAQFSSLLSVAFIGNMRLFYQLISCLLEDMIKQANKKQHKVLFRRFESITQRLTVNWLVMSLYDHIKTNGGMQLFMLYKATQTVVEKGPIDAVNLSCKYTLAEERLLKTRVDCETMKLAIDLNGNGDTTIPVEVLDCDTISQVKHKCCSAIYKNKPASEIPKTEDLELEWHAGKGGKLTLQDVDNISDRSNGMLRLNTLKHYLVKDGSVMALMYKDTTDEPDDMYVNQVMYMRQLMENYGQGQPGSPASPDHIKLLIPSENHSDMHKWHLSNLTDEEKSNNEHEIGEIFLNRLFHTKLVLKEYIDVAFEGVVDPQSLSEPVRYFLCMLDKQGKDVGVDSDVLQNWKSECYATRVWASMIAKPQLLFDVDVPTHVEPCMDILKQVFIDSFTQNPQNVTKEASTQKLLFCKDIPIYRKLVNSFFMKVEPVNDQQFWRVLDDISNNQTQELKFSRQAILHQLYKFIFRYREKILDAFEDDEECKNLDFARKLENVTELMEEA